MTGKNRTVAGNKINTAAVVRQALETVNSQTLDTAKARELLTARMLMGYPAPTEEQIERYAHEKAVLSELQKLTGANVTGQIGKWDMSSEESILAAFDSYLNRRIAGQHARWSK